MTGSHSSANLILGLYVYTGFMLFLKQIWYDFLIRPTELQSPLKEEVAIRYLFTGILPDSVVDQMVDSSYSEYTDGNDPPWIRRYRTVGSIAGSLVYNLTFGPAVQFMVMVILYCRMRKE